MEGTLGAPVFYVRQPSIRNQKRKSLREFNKASDTLQKILQRYEEMDPIDRKFKKRDYERVWHNSCVHINAISHWVRADITFFKNFVELHYGQEEKEEE